MSDTPAALRARIAELNVPRYIVAAAAGYHPATLGKWLSESQPLPVIAAKRVRNALERLAATAQELR